LALRFHVNPSAQRAGQWDCSGVTCLYLQNR